jgi:TonB family protein
MVDIPDHPSTAKGLWFLAALIALMLHLGLAAFAVAHMQDNDSDELGAPAIEIGLELTSPDAPATDLPPGPDSDASVASPAIQEQKAAVKDVELPKEIPVEAENPDRIVTIDKSKEPTRDEPDLKAQEAKPSEESAAQEATAVPAIQSAAVGPKSATLDQGTGESRQRVRVTWQKELIAHLDKHKRYPADHQKAARILLLINLDRTGRVISASVLKSSGDESFDAAALSTVQRASPVPPPPPLVADESLSFSLPVDFRAVSKR